MNHSELGTALEKIEGDHSHLLYLLHLDRSERHKFEAREYLLEIMNDEQHSLVDKKTVVDNLPFSLKVLLLKALNPSITFRFLQLDKENIFFNLGFFSSMGLLSEEKMEQIPSDVLTEIEEYILGCVKDWNPSKMDKTGLTKERVKSALRIFPSYQDMPDEWLEQLFGKNNE